MVTGGYGSNLLDSMETLATDGGSWVTSGAKLPRPMSTLGAANIDDRVLIFGNYTLFITHQISQELQEAMVVILIIIMMTFWSMTSWRTNFMKQET